MKRTLLVGAIGVAACIGVAIMAPWSAPPPLAYESVSGYPMRVYYRNVGDSPIKVVAAGGLPALSDEPLSQERIDGYFDEVRKVARPANSLVKGGEYVRFVVDDPDGLAWAPGKTDHLTYFYLFAIIESPRSALIGNKWFAEVCLVSKTNEPFRRCETHNDVRAGS